MCTGKTQNFKKILAGDTAEPLQSERGDPFPNPPSRRASGAASLRSSSVGAWHRRLFRFWYQI